MPAGSVKFYRSSEGWGFIANRADQRDYFVHASQVRRAGYAALAEGQRVQFDIGSNAKTRQRMAVDMKLLEQIISTNVTPTAFRPETPRETAEAACMPKRMKR